MAGIKGRSGRKSRYEEARSGELRSLCDSWLIDNFDSFDKETKLRVALAISPKGIQQHHEHTGSVLVELADRMMEARQRFASHN